MNKELEALNILRDNHIQFTKEKYGQLDKEKLQNIINLKLSRWNILEKALKRNEPMKVIKDTVINGVCLDYNCPHCKERIDNDKYSKDQYYLIKHCISCGQALDWNDDEIKKEKENK